MLLCSMNPVLIKAIEMFLVYLNLLLYNIIQRERRNFRYLIGSPYAELIDAMMEEINALDDNSSWDLVKLLAGKKAIGCKWVFAVTINLNGSVARFKTHLVVKGCAQTFGLDIKNSYMVTFKRKFTLSNRLILLLRESMGSTDCTWIVQPSLAWYVDLLAEESTAPYHSITESKLTVESSNSSESFGGSWILENFGVHC
ncbi:uncharacterized protein LOC123218832 [Mangifera indica]|uniref:uncharacterized protein LOC123218832 n=1 Tax=Mangifera indica TaxID=29780 RepID=UPI001CFBCC55|nr:uncharacterized protein LOC123218832 [Mangifera indica]XP_044496421.1 uncharacterized protein LOC123218832 [Mangifera indica]